jgi:hypothetical protein
VQEHLKSTSTAYILNSIEAFQHTAFEFLLFHVSQSGGHCQDNQKCASMRLVMQDGDLSHALAIYQAWKKAGGDIQADTPSSSLTTEPEPDSEPNSRRTSVSGRRSSTGNAKYDGQRAFCEQHQVKGSILGMANAACRGYKTALASMGLLNTEAEAACTPERLTKAFLAGFFRKVSGNEANQPPLGETLGKMI